MITLLLSNCAFSSELESTYNIIESVSPVSSGNTWDDYAESIALAPVSGSNSHEKSFKYKVLWKTAY